MEIEKFRDGWLVWYCGDEIYFATYEEAAEFIQEMEDKDE